MSLLVRKLTEKQEKRNTYVGALMVVIDSEIVVNEVCIQFAF